MCGIIGFCGQQLAAPVVIESLSRLEYRGYDSAGIATVADGKLYICKGTGKLDEVEAACQLSKLPGFTGIGHVRWATHGGVTVANAHPHCDCHQKVAIVHNGIIENHQQLRQMLGGSHQYSSQTDSEVIAHLVEQNLATGLNLHRAVTMATRQLQGTWAIVATCSLEPDTVVAARNGSPLVVGIGDCENFIASDLQAFLTRTRQAIFIEDGESVVLSRSKVQLFDRHNKRLHRAPVTIDYGFTNQGKDGYQYYMIKEIMEQPAAIMNAMQQDKIELHKAVQLINNSKSIVFTACGTSRYASLVGRYLFSNIGHRFSDVVIASEFGYFSQSVGPGTLVIAVSQSGETADVLDGVKQARNKGARILSIVNTVGSSLARMSDQVLYLNCGPEIGVPATKSYISDLVVFYMLSAAMAGRLDEFKTKITRVAGMISDNLLLNNVSVPVIADQMSGMDKFYFISRGINFATAGEAALKLKEVAYVHAEGMPAGELKHGTLALIEEGTPVVAIAPTDLTHDHILSNVAEVKARGGYVIGVSDKPDDSFDAYIEVPQVEEIFYPLVTIVPLQLLSFHSAIVRGLDPDRPRNLAKSVTVK